MSLPPIRVQLVPISPSRQRNAVSEGIALGLLMCGRDVLPFDKMNVDLSFEGAWRGWTYRSRFSQVSTDLRQGLDGCWAMTHADERKHVWNLYWDTSGSELVIRARGQRADEDIDPQVVAESIDGDVPALGWRGLAEDFLTRFER